MEKVIDKRTILYSIRKAKKSGVNIQEENSSLGMEEFYRLNCLTRKKHCVPSQPKIFFDKFYEYLVNRGLASIYLAKYNSETIASSVFLKFGDVYYFKYNASDEKFLSKVTPNHLLTWNAISKAYEQGYRLFDFGRTSPENEGLMRYKLIKAFLLPTTFPRNETGTRSANKALKPIIRKVPGIDPISTIKIMSQISSESLASQGRRRPRRHNQNVARKRTHKSLESQATFPADVPPAGIGGVE